MLRAHLRGLAVAAAAVLAVWTTPFWARAAEDRPGGLTGFSGFGPGGATVVALEAQFTRPTADQPARLLITATIKPGYHIYSITQAPGGPLATVIKLSPSQAYRLIGDFQSAPLPKKEIERVFNNLVVEKHYDRVIWHAPIELAPGADPAAVQIEGAVRIQACDSNTCLPPREFPFTARLGPGMELPESAPPESAHPPQAPPRPQQPLAARQASRDGYPAPTERLESSRYALESVRRRAD